jgi:hypothetical protein
MAKYQVEVTFDLGTTIEFDGDVQYALDTSDVEDFEDNSYFGSREIDSDGGEVTFVVEAEDEDDAYSIAEGVVSDGAEIEDSSSITWVVTNVNIGVEKIEIPMDLERAREILNSFAIDQDPEEEVVAAIRFVFDHIATLTAKVAAIEAKLAEAEKLLAEVKASIPAPPVVTEAPAFLRTSGDNA